IGRVGMRRVTAALVGMAVGLLVAGCAEEPGTADHDAPTPGPSEPAAARPTDPARAPSDVPLAVGTPPTPVQFRQGLHDELVAMLAADQEERTGAVGASNDRARTERLKEIIAEWGWPIIDLVGEDGEDAAWAIAQHS